MIALLRGAGVEPRQAGVEHPAVAPAPAVVVIPAVLMVPAVPAGVAARAVARVAHGSEAEETEAEGETDHGMSFHL